MTDTKNDNKKIAFIGCGNMAQAIIGGLVESGWAADNIIASNPSMPKLALVEGQFSIRTTLDNKQAANFGDIVVIAVKPQKMADAIGHLSDCDFTDKLIISVAAGQPIKQICKLIGQSPTIVRAMPNTPALIKQGATGVYAPQSISEANKAIVKRIFEAIGTITWVDKESQIDMVTAIAGSSPAYVFLMMQAMIEQAQSAGLSDKQAFGLVTQAFSGAAQLAQSMPDKSLEQLRREVTSPGGTTAAAITSLKNADFESIVKQAVRAAENRGKELAG